MHLQPYFAYLTFHTKSSCSGYSENALSHRSSTQVFLLETIEQNYWAFWTHFTTGNSERTLIGYINQVPVGHRVALHWSNF